MLLPIAIGGVAGVALVSRMIRHDREARLRENIGLCMAARGHAASDWKLARN